ncbi:MAG: hypothetical protein IH958_04245 [Chloroflexi bacterium]|nr:hypothetical protein [Chloroflexota bacterium]
MLSMEQPATFSALGHLGSHITISLILFGPFENVARFLWTLFFRLKAEALGLVLQGSKEDRDRARKVHTLTVALLSLIPFVGMFAYVAAKPLRNNRALLAILFDGALRKLPFNLYHGQHLAVLTCWLATSGPGPSISAVARRWFPPRPRLLLASAREALANVRPHWKIASVLLAANLIAVAIAVTAHGLTGTLSDTFGEFGALQTLKAGELLLAGVVGYYIYSRFWRLPNAEQRVDAPGSFFWILSAGGFVWLGIDDYFGLHERLGGVIESLSGTSVPLLNNPDDLILLGYGIAGLTLAVIFLGELRRSRAVFPIMAAGVGFMAISQVIDFFAPEQTVFSGLENPTNLIGAGLLLLAYLVKLRDIWDEPRFSSPGLDRGDASEAMTYS